MTRLVALLVCVMSAWQASAAEPGPSVHAGRERMPARRGFPADFSRSPFGGEIRGAVSAVDIDGDGKKEILFGSFDGMIHMFRADGREVHDGLWPRHTGGPIVGTVKAGDLDGDDTPEVVASSYDGKLYAFSDRGDRLWTADTHQPGLTSSPVLTGKPGIHSRGILLSTPDGALHSLNANGSRTWLHPNGPPVGTPPAEVDLAGTGDRQVLIRDDSGVFSLLTKDGNLVRKWPSEPYSDRNGPAAFHVADTDGDGIQEIAAVQKEALSPGAVPRAPGCWGTLPPQGEQGVFVWTPAGEAASMFPVDPAVGASLRTGDLNGDGAKELLFADEAGRVHVTALDGKPRTGWPLDIRDVYKQVDDPRLDPRGRPAVERAPVLADIDGDGASELVFCVNDPRQADELGGMVIAVDAAGKLLAGFPKYVGRNHGEMLVADLDDDGDMELVVPGGIGATSRQLHVFDLPTSQKLEMIFLGSDFQMFKGE
ncbi:MAG: VCBS repeat-containing protein [Candidatus Wallbacteria bacterium]|nr:VCBS repeat-containing protein [Candidatus Wallbacteria bacterium]